MRLFRSAVCAIALIGVAPAAFADDTAGLQVLIDMQDPALVSKTFCVNESKLYSVDAQVCVSSSVKMSCTLVDANDPSKGVKWIVADEKSRCRQ